MVQGGLAAKMLTIEEHVGCSSETLVVRHFVEVLSAATCWEVGRQRTLAPASLFDSPTPRVGLAINRAVLRPYFFNARAIWVSENASDRGHLPGKLQELLRLSYDPWRVEPIQWTNYQPPVLLAGAQPDLQAPKMVNSSNCGNIVLSAA